MYIVNNKQVLESAGQSLVREFIKDILALDSCIFLTTILAKIYVTNFSVSVKYRTTGKVQSQYLNSFLLVLTKF